LPIGTNSICSNYRDSLFFTKSVIVFTSSSDIGKLGFM
jgi:hypothetical protein